MLRRRSPSLALALMAVLWAPLSARAEAPSCGSISDSRSNVFIKLIMPPPCDDCEETKAELKELAQIQDARSPRCRAQAAFLPHSHSLPETLVLSKHKVSDGCDLRFDERYCG